MKAARISGKNLVVQHKFYHKEKNLILEIYEYYKDGWIDIEIGKVKNLSNKIKDYTSGIFVMKREVLVTAVPIGHGHGEFFIEFIYKALKAGVKIIELPYVQPPDVEKMSKTASSTFRFCFLGFNYFIRLIQTLFGRN